ncbi:MAG TPA: hypothetical protein VE861_07055, partial [Gemmatimonadaceae bacterium]|nr:hypothetical protein [Gemmatimonadaceae bacterium]
GPLDAAGTPIYNGEPLTAPVPTPAGAKLGNAPTPVRSTGADVAVGTTPGAAMPAATAVPARPAP